MTSPISSPQNIFAIQEMGRDAEPPSWLAWFAVALPVACLGNLACWGCLLLAYRPGRTLKEVRRMPTSSVKHAHHPPSCGSTPLAPARRALAKRAHCFLQPVLCEMCQETLLQAGCVGTTLHEQYRRTASQARASGGLQLYFTVCIRGQCLAAGYAESRAHCRDYAVEAGLCTVKEVVFQCRTQSPGSKCMWWPSAWPQLGSGAPTPRFPSTPARWALWPSSLWSPSSALACSARWAAVLSSACSEHSAWIELPLNRYSWPLACNRPALLEGWAVYFCWAVLLSDVRYQVD